MIKKHNIVVNKVKVLKHQANKFVSNILAKFGKDYFLSEAQIKQKIDDLIKSGNLKIDFPIDNQNVSKMSK